jgi:hypothetical protein
MGRSKISSKEKRVPTSFACRPVTLKDIDHVRGVFLGGVSQSRAIEILVCKGIKEFINTEGLE